MRVTPVRVVGLDGVEQIVVSNGHSCARRAGSVLCWGYNLEGELGNGTLESSSVPVEVVRVRDAIELAADGWQTCARRASGGVVCWGRNDDGALGIGVHAGYARVPTAVVGIE